MNKGEKQSYNWKETNRIEPVCLFLSGGAGGDRTQPQMVLIINEKQDYLADYSCITH